MSSELMKKVTGFVLIAPLLCSLSFLLKLCLVPVTYRKLMVSSRIFTCASRSINFLSPLQLQRAQLQERASDQGCSLHLSHWARVFLCHLMLHELLGGFFPVFLPFLAIVGWCLAKVFFHYIVCTRAGEPVLAWTVGFQHTSLSSIILQGELWNGDFSFLPMEIWMVYKI